MDNFLIAKATDVGITRQVNEDSMTVFDSPNGQVMAVCDGMGGQAAGDVASQLAVSIIENILTDNKFDTPEEAIKRSVLAANQGILNRTSQNPELEGMGATCVMLIIKDGRVHCGWVGDSRIYYISNHTIRQISHDQSYVQQLVDSGQISQAEADSHPQKNEITNCIGLQGMTAPETVAVPIVPEPGSVFLLCSDGLSGMVKERTIEHVISNNEMTLQEKADRLIALANEAGGLDNITVELVQFGTNDTIGATSGTLFETPKGVKRSSKKKSRSMLYTVICALLIAGLGGGGYYWYLQNHPKPKPEEKTEQKGNTEEPKQENSVKTVTPDPAANSDTTPQGKQEAEPKKTTPSPKVNPVKELTKKDKEEKKDKDNKKPIENLIEGQENKPEAPKDLPEVLKEKDN